MMPRRNIKIIITAPRWRAVMILLFVFLSPKAELYAQWTLSGLQGGESIQCFTTLGKIIFVGIGTDVYSSSDDGKSWQWSSNGLRIGDGAQSLTSIGSILVVGMVYSGIFLSTDSGASWHSTNTNFPTEPAFFAMTEHDGVLFAGTNGDGIYRSSDSGRNWEIDTNGIPWSMYVGSSAYSFGSLDSILFSGSIIGEVYRTSNDGESWEVYKVDPLNNTIDGIASVGSKLFCGGYGIYVSTDKGVTWLPADSGLTSRGDSDVNCMIAVNGVLLAGTYDGVFRSIDSGRSWKPFSQGMVPVGTCFALDTLDGYIFTDDDYGGGIYRRPISDLAGVNKIQLEPSVDQKISAYPNPLTQSSTITISCAESGAGEVTIVNLLGVEVARLFSGELGSGEHSFVWDASGVAAGTYFCALRTINGVQRVAMVVTR
jgi:photosystem II stability/assembly factor-like uncharacterized protein